MATARVPQVPKSNTNLSVPVPFPLKGAPIPLLLLTLPSQLGAAVPFSAQPFVVQRRRAFHRSLTARAVSLDWPVRPWMRGLFSSRRRLQSKVQLHRWSLARRDVEWPRRVHANAAPPSSSPSGQPPGMQPPNGAQPPPVATTPDVSMSMDAPVVPPSSSVTDSTSETHSDWLLTGRHFLTFIMVLVLGVVASALYLYTARDVEFSYALYKSSLDLLRTTGFRQTLALVGAIIFVRFGLEPIVRLARHIFGVRGPWAQSSEYYLLKEVYRPIEGLLVVAAFATLVENFAPSLIAIPKATVSHVVHSILSIAFVMATAGVIFNVKARMVKETAWQLELSGKLTQQRRVEAIDKLLTLLTLLVSSILGLQAVGLDINSLLAIGGIGGLAAGLAGRELLENLFNGMIIMSSNPFEVGEEVIFHHNGREVEGIVLDVGWYRTTIRSFAREVFVIPNSVFSRTVVLNVTRKNGEWRFYEFLHLRPEDVDKARDIVADMRKVIRTHPSVIQKLHRRAFLDSLTKEECGIYLSFYCAATNRDAFMAIRQDLFMMFLDIIKQHGAQLAKKSLRVYLQDRKSVV